MILKWTFYTNVRGNIKTYIQGDSRGKANILGGDSVSHCEGKSLDGHESNSEWLPR
jgi:hypothetical protein